MMTLLLLKSKIKNFYEKHYRITRGICKFIIMFGALLLITMQMDYNEFLGQYWLLAIVSGVCAVTPDGMSLIFFFLLVCGEISGVSVLLAATVLVIIVIYLLLYGRFERKQYYLVFLIPVLAPLHISYVVPIVAALFASPVLLPALVMGIIVQFMIQGVMLYASASMGVAESEDILSSLQFLMDYLMKNQLMFVTIIAFCLTFVCVYMIRKGNFNHASQIAILVGAIVLMSAELLSNIILELELNLAILTVQVVASMAVAYVVQFFHMTLDYRGTRRLQFEDDEYYYYVTAVPKFKVTVVDRTVTRILQDEEDENLDLREELEKALREEDADNADTL